MTRLGITTLTALSLAIGCQPDATPDALDVMPAEQATPPGDFGIRVSPMVVGRPFTLTVNNANPGQRIFVFRAGNIQAGGFCPAPIAPDCLDLPSNAVNQLSGVADISGVAEFTVTLPAGLAAPQVAWQAVSRNAVSGADTSPAIVVPIHQLADDLDGDGLDAETEFDVTGTNPNLEDTDGGGLLDGDEVSAGLDPLDPDDDAPTIVTVADLRPGDLMITEIMQNPTAAPDSTGEWFEVQNLRPEEVDLQDLLVTDLGSNSFTVQGPLIVPPGQFVVFAVSGDPAVNGGIGVQNPTIVYDYPSGFALGNSDDEIILSGPNGPIDEVAYDGGPAFPDPSAASMQLDPRFSLPGQNQIAINWCTAVVSENLGAGDLGTPGLPNTPCPPITWVSDVSDLLARNCSGCHINGGTSGGANFDNYADMFLPSNDVPSMPRITPREPENSYLWHKVSGTHTDVGGSGGQMPLGGVFEQWQLDVLTRWITDGAPER